MLEMIHQPSLKALANKKRTGTTYGKTDAKLEFFKTNLLIPLIQKCFCTKGNGWISFKLSDIRNYELYGSRHPRKLFDEYFTIEHRAGRSPHGESWSTKLSMSLPQILKANDLLREYGIKPVVSDDTGDIISWYVGGDK